MSKFLLLSMLIFILALQTLDAIAQNGIIKGTVKNAETGSPIEFASLQLEGTPHGATTDEDGYFFILNIQPGNYNLLVSSIGYEHNQETITLKENQVKTLSISLTPTTYSLDEIAISGERTKLKKQIRISEIEVLPASINRLPSIGSMPDIAQHLQTLPGVITTGDAGSQIYIRGGSPVQNKVIMDGVVIYNPFHSSGLHSVFDVDVIRKVEVFTGGFGAEYGGSISSVMDISTRSGNINNYSGRADISTIGGKILLEGPVFRPKQDSKSNASFLAYYKTSYFDKASQSYYSYVDQNLPFNFHDIYGKFTLFSGDVFKADLFGFSFRDHTGYPESTVNYSWKNQGFGGNIIMSPSYSSSVVQAYFAASTFKSELEELSYTPRESGVSTVNLGIRINNYFSTHYVKYGIELLTLKTDYLYYTTGFNATEQQNNTSEASAFIMFFGDFNKLLIQPGFRLTLYSTLNKIAPEPRISMKYLLLENLRIKLAGGLYTQNLIGAVSDRDIINYFRGYLSAPISIASTKDINNSDYLLQKSNQLIGGLEYEPVNSLLFNIEAYYKYYPQLINYNRNKKFNEFDYPDKPELLIKDFILETGQSRGIEFTGEYSLSRISLTLVYSYSETTRTYEDSQGEKVAYYPHYDRRHNLNLLGSVYLDERLSWQFNVRWNFGSGFPFTPSRGYYESVTIDENEINNFLTQNGSMEIVYGEYNSGRLPNYHRMDMSIKKTFRPDKRSKIELEANIVNVYNQKNIYYVDRLTNDYIYQLPFLPGLSFAYSF